MTTRDARLDVFLSAASKDVFHSVEHRGQIWREDPFDVASVHEQARAQFQRLLTQVTTPPGLDAGRILLLLGEAGSGKTHLVRAFRNHVHMNGFGFVGYMQMTTSVSSYSRYLVSNLIDSLDQPYYETLGTDSGLLRLSNAIAARCGDSEAIRALREIEALETDAIVDLVERATDRLITQPRFADLDLDLVRALLYLQRQDPALKKRAVKYLRCEALSDRDQRLLGGLAPKLGEQDAQQLVEQLGRLMWACDSRALVLCVDQFEDAFRSEDAQALFRRVVSSLCAVADQVPSTVIVIACLEDYYKEMCPRLTRSMIDRIERQPPPARLTSARGDLEVQQIIQQRLAYLYETAHVLPAEGTGDPLYPLPGSLVQRLSGLRVRDILNECHSFREACIDAGRIIETQGLPAPSPAQPSAPEERLVQAAKEQIEQEWNDFLSQYQEEPPEEDAEIAEIFGWAIQNCADELKSGYRFEVKVDGATIVLGILVPTKDGGHARREEIFVAVCNKAPQGGGLGKQFEEARRKAKGRKLALLRCGEFPRKPGTAVHTTLADILKKGGRAAVLEESDQRTIAAFRSFRSTHERREHFAAWSREENRLSRLSPLIKVLDLDHLDRFEQDTSPVVAMPRSPRTKASALDASTLTPEEPHPATNGNLPPRAPNAVPLVDAVPLALGTTGTLIAQALTFDAGALTAHAAFLGSTGSGKTTLALNLIEQLLSYGIPAILIDRKGDLCGYAREKLWSQSDADPMLERRRRALREKLDIALFTPGAPRGRQLALSLVPRGLTAVEDFEREQAAGYAAQALGDMLGYKHTRSDKTLRTILVQAFQLFATYDASNKLDLEALIAFIDDEDPALVAALDRIDTRLCKRLVQDLAVLKLSSSDLLSRTGEQLDADLLFGLGPHAQPGRTRLSIISTKFLGDDARILFWVSHLLLTLSRWVSRTPSSRLQAVVLFDEADLYLPAQSQPATKAPLENLLRRARSGGLGLLLATQSPGDLDYKCRDNLRSWFVGRVTQAVALEKMRPLFSEARVDVAANIPGQNAGEFHLLQEGRVTAFKGEFPLLRTEQVPDDEILKLAAHRRPSRRGRP